MTAEPSKKKRVFYLDVLRALAIVGVVVLHTAALGWVSVAPQEADWQACNVYDSMVRWCVPVFVMLSGALMLDPSREVSFERLLTKNVARMALVFFAWSAVYLVWDVSQGVVALDPMSLIGALLTGHYHLWYLQMQAFLYLAVPLLRPIAANRRLAELLVCLSAALCFVPNLVFMSQAATQLLGPAFANANLSFAGGYVGYFVLGYYLSRVSIAKPVRMGLYVLGVAAVAFTALGTSWLSVDAGFARGELYDYLMPNTLVASAALFVAVRYGLGGERGDRVAAWLPGRAVVAVAGSSFGIYLVHVLVLEVLQALGVSPCFAGAALGVPVLSVGVLLVSFGLVWLLGRIAPLRRVL